MTDYDNTNRGVLFDNDRKETDKHPDMTGKLNVNGVDHWFSGWWKESKSGAEFLSLSLGKPVENQQQEQTRQQEPQRRGNRPSGNRAPPPAPPRRSGGGGFNDQDDDIPWSQMAAGRAFLAM